LKLPAEDGVDFPDLVGVARGDEQRCHTGRLSAIPTRASGGC
jgi:hypothetical protein